MCTALTIVGLLLTLAGVLVLLRFSPRGARITGTTHGVDAGVMRWWLTRIGCVALFAGFGLQLVAGFRCP
jgi:hypothetical protein